MRILFVSNYYPPHTWGGYEQWCAEVGVSLVERGHQVCVLTSTEPQAAPGSKHQADDRGVDVRRVIRLEVESGLVEAAVRLLGPRARLEQNNLTQVQVAVSEFQPDLALIWGMWNVPRSVPALVEELLGSRVAYYFCDYWPSLPSAYLQQWQAPARRRLGGIPKGLLSRPIIAHLERQRPAQLRFEHPICVSQAVRNGLVQAGIGIHHATVVYGGTRVNDVGPREARSDPGDTLRLLYAGRLTPTKGVHTAIEAVARLVDQGECAVCLDVVGRGERSYEQELNELARRRGLNGRVVFRGGVAQEDMPHVLRQHDALLLLSEWEEPFARIVLEAMAAGLVVIGTTTGGTGEVLVEDQTGLTFPRGDSAALANQIKRLVNDSDLRIRLAQAGRQCVENRFTFQRMVDQLEQKLLGIGSP